MKIRMFWSAAVSLIASAALGTIASAGSIPVGKQLDFSGGTGGIFSYTPGLGNTASVKNAPIGKVTGFPSFLNLSITDGTLDFTTGPCIATCGSKTNKAGVTTSVPQFGQSPSGGLTLYGGIASLGIADNTALIDGIFVPSGKHPAAGFSLTTKPGANSGMDGYLQVLSINPALLTYFNINSAFTGGNGHLTELLLNLSFVTNSWNGTIEHSDLNVTPALPEPTSLLLFGSSILFAAYLLRKKLIVRPAHTDLTVS